MLFILFNIYSAFIWIHLLQYTVHFQYITSNFSSFAKSAFSWANPWNSVLIWRPGAGISASTTAHALHPHEPAWHLGSPQSWYYACWVWREKSRHQPPSLFPVQGKQNKSPNHYCWSEPLFTPSHPEVWTNRRDVLAISLLWPHWLWCSPEDNHKYHLRQLFVRTGTKQPALAGTHHWGNSSPVEQK